MSSTLSSPVSRRAVLHSGAAFAAAAVLPASVLGAIADPGLPVVDTHQHLWDLEQFRLPWLQSAPDVLKRTWNSKDYQEATDGLNVVQAVYMEVDVHPDEQTQEANALLELCRAASTVTTAAVISGRPGLSQFESWIRQFADKPEIKGVRQVLHAPEAMPGLCLESQFVSSVRLLGELNRSFDLCMRPGELSDGLRLVQQCTETRFVLDHCGNASPEAFLPERLRTKKATHDAATWKNDVAKLADCPNVVCKISGVIASAPVNVPLVDALAPIIEHCLKCFGPDRVVFGGDWPVCLLRASFREWLEVLKTIVSNRPLDEQRRLFADNARRFYGLATPQ